MFKPVESFYYFIWAMPEYSGEWASSIHVELRRESKEFIKVGERKEQDI